MGEILTLTQRRLEQNGNGELPAPGRRGAGAAPRRLEEQEERGYARLQIALSTIGSGA